MAGLTCLAQHACHGGTQGFWQHDSKVVGLPMRFGVYQPPQAKKGSVPMLLFLAGLTCNEETFAIKAGAQRFAAQHGVTLVTPDTSPRGVDIPGADAEWDFGIGAGFYIDATQQPWAAHWRMESYITLELLDLVRRQFGAAFDRTGIFGHSMGGHGALTLALKHPGLFTSVSALAPIAAPTQVPWGIKAFSRYLGDDPARWKAHDATELLKAGARAPRMLVDQGLADKFLAEQLGREALLAACEAANQPLLYREHAGYDHGYYFISTFVEDHIRHHAG
jgi:S-formylglutathione hydrolase